MPEITKDEVNKLLQKYKGELQVEMSAPEQKEKVKESVETKTRAYQQFKDEYVTKKLSTYENACKQAENLISIKPEPKKFKIYEDAIRTTHMNVTPTGVYSLAVLLPVIIGLLGMVIALAFGSLYFTIFFLASAFVLYFPLASAPQTMANSWKLKASNQMVLAIFYTVTYMRHTSNLELAIDFASERLGAPLGLDLKRVLWGVETEKFGNIKEALDDYLKVWRDSNMEFVESMHLIEGSLFEGAEESRLGMLDKALDVILEETYEKMLHYAHNLKSPITMLHMLGIILPILTLVILPLVVSFMEGIKWYHLAMMYDVVLPLAIFYLGKKILSTRPSGSAGVDISNDPRLKNKRKLKIFGTVVDPLPLCIMIGVALFLVGVSPLLIHFAAPGWDVVYLSEAEWGQSQLQTLPVGTYVVENIKYSLLEYKYDSVTGETLIGPFGLVAAILGCFIPIALGLSVGLYYRLRTQNVLKIRNDTKKLEDEFASALFQLGNRLGDGFPAEIAFQKVAIAMEGTTSGEFFNIVSSNITRLGMSVEDALFDENIGAISKFPSDTIRTSMKVLVESAKKGPLIAAEALINVSKYIKQMHSVDERLKDLLADIISSMNSQIKFLSPVISGIVIGITSMVTSILGRLSGQLQKLATDQSAMGGGNIGITSLFGDGLPTFYFQLIVGLYVVELAIIMTSIVNSIENGSDKLNGEYLIGQNAVKSTLLYSGIAIVIMVLFNIVAANLIGTGLG